MRMKRLSISECVCKRKYVWWTHIVIKTIHTLCLLSCSSLWCFPSLNFSSSDDPLKYWKGHTRDQNPRELDAKIKSDWVTEYSLGTSTNDSPRIHTLVLGVKEKRSNCAWNIIEWHCKAIAKDRWQHFYRIEGCRYISWFIRRESVNSVMMREKTDIWSTE